MKQITNTDKPWETASAIITTFTREHVSFHGDNLKCDIRWEPHAEEWQPLLDEIKALGTYPSNVIFSKEKWKSSMAHLDWLMWMHNALYIIWSLLILFAVAYLWKCLSI